MVKSRAGWVAAIVMAAVAVCIVGKEASARGGPANETLAKHGLKLAGTLVVANEEADVKTKLSEVRRLSKQLSYALVDQQGTMSPEEQKQNKKAVTDQISQLRTEMNMASQQINAIPKYRGRFMSADASDLFAQLNAYRSQLQMEINQDSLFLNQLNSQPADPKAKEKVDSQVRDRRDAYHQAILDLRKLVDGAYAKYEEAAQNDDIKKALGALGKGLREKPKLGPSHDFLASVKVLEKLEKAESTGETDGQESRSKARHHARTKTKTSTKAAAGDSDKSP